MKIKFIWEHVDIARGRKVCIPASGEVWQIGFMTGNGACYTLNNLTTGEVRSPFTDIALAAEFNHDGWAPADLNFEWQCQMDGRTKHLTA